MPSPTWTLSQPGGAGVGIVNDELLAVREGVAVQLSAAASASYAWAVVDAPAGEAAIASATSQVASWTPAALGYARRVRLRLTTPDGSRILVAEVSKNAAGTTVGRGYVVPAFGERKRESANGKGAQSVFARFRAALVFDVDAAFARIVSLEEGGVGGGASESYVDDAVMTEALSRAAADAALSARIAAAEPTDLTGSINNAAAQAFAAMTGGPIAVGEDSARVYRIALSFNHGTLGAGETATTPAHATEVVRVIAWRDGSSPPTFIVEGGTDALPWTVDAEAGVGASHGVDFQPLASGDGWTLEARKGGVSANAGTIDIRARVTPESANIPWTSDTAPSFSVLHPEGESGAVEFADMAAAVATASSAGVAWDVNGDDGGLWGVAAAGHIQLTAGEIAITGSSIAIGTTAGNGVTVGNTTGSTYLIGATCNLGTGAGNVTTAGNTTGVTEVTGSTTRIKSAGDVVLRPTGHSTDACAWQVASGYARWYAGSSGITGLALASPSNATYCLIDNGQFFVSAGGTGINLVGAGSVQLVSTASSATLGALGVASIDNGSGVFVRRYGVGVERIGIRTPADVGTASTARVVLATIPIPTGAMRRLRASVKGWPAGAAGGAWTVDVHVENVGGSLTKYAETIALVTGTQNLGTVDVTINGTNIEIGVTPAAASSRTWHANDMGDV
jgi:hypothetical protein